MVIKYQTLTMSVVLIMIAIQVVFWHFDLRYTAPYNLRSVLPKMAQNEKTLIL